MSQEIPEQRRRSQAENQTLSKSDISLKERFFRYFQHEIIGTQSHTAEDSLYLCGLGAELTRLLLNH